MPASYSSSQPLPLEFDPKIYGARYADLRRMSARELESHYQEHGLAEGRVASAIAGRPDFVALLADIPSILEIGPLANPTVRGSNAKYFDVLPTEALKRKAQGHGLDAAQCPPIHFVSETGDLGVITETFDAVVSSHAIEHQPDLIGHLSGVAKLLKPSGRYFVAMPDKRYCFDHFICQSTIADVLGARLRQRRLHDATDVIEHLALTTHNDPVRHWNGDHGAQLFESKPESLGEAVNLCLQNADVYLDTHAWQFAPSSFRDILQTLARLRLCELRVKRVYPTVRNSIEFYAVLEKTGETVDPLFSGLPKDFDTDEYLRANPDVAAAGIDATSHYLNYGRREGRRLRP